MNFGERYPEELEIRGKVLKLVRETRWTRYFNTDAKDCQLAISRFQDGSASITVAQLEKEWPKWSAEEQDEFCSAVGCGSKEQGNELLRFLLRHADCAKLCAFALAAAHRLPHEELVPRLKQCIEAAPPGRAMNLIQALAATRVPEANSIIEERLDVLWAHPKLWEDKPFINWIAAEAANCIHYLVQLGVPKEQLADRAHQLLEHPNKKLREAVMGQRLVEHFGPSS